MGRVSSWSGLGDAYLDSFATLCGGTIDRLLADAPGERHPDVGSGTGELAGRAATLGRKVVAIDADPDMVAMSNVVVPGKVLQAALPDLPFNDDEFDAVTANFVINHVADPRASMRELARVTRPGGRVAVTIWPPQPAVWGVLVSGAFSAAGVAQIASQRLSPELDFERSVDGLRGIAEVARLEIVRAEELRWDWEISIDALWRGISGGVTTAGQTLRAQTPETQTSVEQEFRRAAQNLTPDGILRLPSAAAYLLAAA